MAPASESLTLSLSRTHSLQLGGPFFQLNLDLLLSDAELAGLGSTGDMLMSLGKGMMDADHLLLLAEWVNVGSQ